MFVPSLQASIHFIKQAEQSRDFYDGALLATSIGAGSVPLLRHVNTPAARHYDAQHAALTRFNEFKKLLRPGDIILEGDNYRGIIPTAVNLTSGTPKSVHVSVVDTLKGLGGKIDSHPAYGLFRTPMQDNLAKHPAYNYLALRYNDKQNTALMLSRLREFADATADYSENMRKALKDRGFKGSRAEDIIDRALSTLYRKNTGVSSGLMELASPLSQTDMSYAKKQLADTMRFIRNNKTYSDKTIKMLDEALASGKNPQSVISDITAKVFPRCAGGVCSTVPAVLGNFNVAEGKSPASVLPVDYLKSPNFKLVGKYERALPQTVADKTYHRLLSKGPLLSRLGLSGLIGGGVFAAGNTLLNAIYPDKVSLYDKIRSKLL